MNDFFAWEQASQEIINNIIRGPQDSFLMDECIVWGMKYSQAAEF